MGAIGACFPKAVRDSSHESSLELGRMGGPTPAACETGNWPASGDAPMRPEPLDRIRPDQEIASVTADGTFVTRMWGSGHRLAARDFVRQAADFQIRMAVLNVVTAPGIPVSKVAGQVCPGIGEPRKSNDLCNRAG